uniref:Uncharacterized protein n=1 Tax=Cyanistes caeruleus TaxID=156563 RepID=A0A8C0U7A9_CYACU
ALAACSADLNTNYPDVVVVTEKILLGKSSRKKSSNQKTEHKVFSIAVCALLNSGRVRMESEDRNYFFQEHGICEDIEMSLKDCIGRSKVSEYFAWMQQRSNLLLFIKTELWRPRARKYNCWG